MLQLHNLGCNSVTDEVTHFQMHLVTVTKTNLTNFSVTFEVTSYITSSHRLRVHHSGSNALLQGTSIELMGENNAIRNLFTCECKIVAAIYKRLHQNAADI